MEDQCEKELKQEVALATKALSDFFIQRKEEETGPNEQHLLVLRCIMYEASIELLEYQVWKLQEAQKATAFLHSNSYLELDARISKLEKI